MNLYAIIRMTVDGIIPIDKGCRIVNEELERRRSWWRRLVAWVKGGGQ
jgi:hypothetical protein